MVRCNQAGWMAITALLVRQDWQNQLIGQQSKIDPF
jgi:hypothetical protein